MFKVGVHKSLNGKGGDIFNREIGVELMKIFAADHGMELGKVAG